MFIGVGDINKDGYNDIIFQGSLSNSDPVMTFYVMYGSSILNSTIYVDEFNTEEGFTIETSTFLFPSSLDFVYLFLNYTVFCEYNSSSNEYVYVYDVNYSNVTENNYAVSLGGNGGDVNDDGYDDIIIGSPFAYTFAGEVFILYGAPKSDWNSTFYLTTLENLGSAQGYIIYGAG
jgi:hypothetical protein